MAVLPDFTKLVTNLNASGVQSWNPELYTILKSLILSVQQSQNIITDTPSGGVIFIPPSGNGGGSGTTFDIDYSGNYVTPKIYNDGDIVVASDGIAYLCVKDGTTTPPETWPGGGLIAHHGTHEPGGTDAIQGAAWVNLANVFTAFQTITDAIPELRLINRDQPVDARIFRIFEQTGTLNFQSTNDAGTVQQGAVNINRQGVITAPAGLGTTPLDGTQINVGTVGDSHLSPNVALKNIDNDFTAVETFLQWITINNNPSYFYMYNPTGGTDLKTWRIVNYGDGTLRFERTDDGINTVLADFEIGQGGNLFKFGGQINFPAAQNPSSNPNSLDDYEEGIWVPTDVSGAGLTLNAQGRYIKVGRHITITSAVTYPSTANGSAAKIGGLPFVAQATQPGGALSSAYTSFAMNHYVRENQSWIEMFNPSTAAAITNVQLSGALIFASGVYITA